jgi:hypothetical protein
MMINPDEERFFQIGKNTLLTEQEFTGIMDDTAPFFVSGELRYRDVFGKWRRYSFRYQTNSVVLRNGGALSISEEGNRST